MWFDAERSSGTRQQCHTRPHHCRHRVQRLPGASVAESNPMERSGQRRTWMWRLPVLLQSHLQHAGCFQLSHQLSDLCRFQHAFSSGARRSSSRVMLSAAVDVDPTGRQHEDPTGRRLRVREIQGSGSTISDANNRREAASASLHGNGSRVRRRRRE